MNLRNVTFRVLFLWSCWVTFFLSGEALSRTPISRITATTDTLLFSFTFQNPPLIRLTEDNQHSLSIPKFYESIFVLCEEGTIDIKITDKQVEIIQTDEPIQEAEDIAIDGDTYSIQSASQDRLELLVQRTIGTIHGKKLVQIVVYPYHYKRSEIEFHWIRKLTVQVTGSGIEQANDELLVSKAFMSNDVESRYVKSPKKSIAKTFIQNVSSTTLPRLKIWVKDEGVVVLPQPLIADAGWELSGIDPRQFRVVGTAGEIPIRIVGEGDGSFDLTDAIEFWGEPLLDVLSNGDRRLDIYANQNVYWLELAEKNGLRLGQEHAGSGDHDSQSLLYPRSYPYNIHFEQDSYFNRLPYATNVDDGDHWFYSHPIGGGEKREFTFTISLPDLYATQLVYFRIKMRGQSQEQGSQFVEVFLNDKQITSGTWIGNQPVLLESQGFSPAYLEEGTNSITVINWSEDGGFVQLMLDWFEITYPRLYEADGDYIRFRAPQYSVGKVCHFEIKGFSTPTVEVYKKGVSYIQGTEIITVPDSVGPTTYTVEFEDLVIDEQTEYIALTSDAKSVPDTVLFRSIEDLRSPAMGADYVMIIPSDSMGNDILQDLIDLRESQGHQVEVIHLDDIYDNFNNGIPNPEAIQRFLRYAYDNWSSGPEYVLLVGDGLTNNRASPDKGNLIPSPQYQTIKYGAAATDHYYSLLIGDDHIPDVAIGRFPVRTCEELRNIVDKIVAYEQSPVEPWCNNYLLIGAGGYNDVFKYQSETLIQQVIKPSFHPERLYLTGDLSDPYVGGTEDLLRHFREGMTVINFRGHGGGAIWSDNGLLDLDDVELIENKGKLPVVTSMTCFTADFAASLQSLGEALVCQKETGAVALWGATGVGWVWNDYYILCDLFRIMSTEPELTFGEMLMRAKTMYLLKNQGDLPLSEVYQFTLLGDPALRLPIPKKDVDFTLKHRAVADYDSICVQGRSDIDNFQILFEITGQDRGAQESHLLSFQQKQWEAVLPVVYDSTESQKGIRTYLYNTQTGDHASGFTQFSVGSTYFDSLCTLPLHPNYQDTIRFSVIAENPEGIKDIWCVIVSPIQGYLTMTRVGETEKYITIKSVGPFLPGTELVYTFLSENSQGTLIGSDTISTVVPSLPDLDVHSVSLEGQKEVVVKVHLRNLGGEDVTNALVRIGCSDLSWTAEDSLNLDGFGTGTVTVPISPGMGSIDLSVSVDPDSQVQDANRKNNELIKQIEVNRFNVSPELGSYSCSTVPDTVGISNKILCFVPPGTVPVSTVLHIEILNNHDGKYSEMELLPSEKMVHLSFPGLSGEAELSGEIMITFLAGFEDSLHMVRPYQWNSLIHRWVYCLHTFIDSTIKIQRTDPGYFRLMDNEDHDSPWIEIQVENQPFIEGSFIPSTPMMSAVIQDESGVDIQTGKISLYFDGILQDPSIMVLPDSTRDPVNITVTFRPELTPGEHTIRMSATDVNGNTGTSETIRFRVGSQLEIQYLGNHPNPFRRQTIFVYVLTDVARKVSLKIYTVSGKLIRTFEGYEMASPDYHEVVWDGNDEWGEEVANGVYFFRLKAEGNKKNQEITGKVAKIR